MTNEKKNILPVIIKLLSYVFNHNKLKSILILTFTVVTAAIEILIAFSMGILIDKYIMPLIGVDNPSFEHLYYTLLKFGLVLFLGVISAFLISRISAYLSQQTLTVMRRDLFSHMQYMSIKYFDTHSRGEIMGLYTNDLDTLIDVISQSIPQAFSCLVTVCMIYVAMLSENLILSFFVTLYIFVVLLLTRTISSRSRKQFILTQKTYGEFNGFVEESIYAQKVIKVFSHEKQSINEFNDFVERHRINDKHANEYANIYMPLLANIGNILYVILVGVGVMFMNSNTFVLGVGSLVTFLQLTRSFTGPFSQISQNLNSIIRGSAGAERIFNFLEDSVEEDSGNTSFVYARLEKDGNLVECDRNADMAKPYWKREFTDTDSEYIEVKGDVRFFNVSFSYDGDKKILDDISLYARPGEKIAFVGSTGAGKTTVTNLVNRFYDIDKGEILIDGINIKMIKKRELRKAIAIVLQETNFFSGTIAQNIRYGRLDASDEDVRRAAEIAHAHKFIENLKDGYDTYISANDSQLSEGQKQLISIARAAIANPPILILDEATSSVDSESEKYVEIAMDEIMKGRTVLVIAHRLSTIVNSSAIMVMESGRIIERGSHEELLSLNGRYAELYNGKKELD